MPRYFPLFLDLQDKPCLVVGAGEIATRKAEQLLHYGARLTIVAPDASADVRHWASEGRVVWRQRSFEPSDLDGALLVVASTNLPDVNRAVFDAASELGVLANIVDVPELCHFTYGALVERGDLQIAISTSGRSPAYAARLKRDLEQQFGPEYEEYVDILGEARARARASLAEEALRKQALQRVMALDLLALIMEGRGEEARRRALACISPSSD